MRCSSLVKFGEPSFDMASKRFEVIQLPAKDLPDQIEIDIEVPVDEYVAESRHSSEMRCEIIG